MEPALIILSKQNNPLAFLRGCLLITKGGNFMLSMLEELEPAFHKKFKQAVNLNEITVFSLQLSPKTALVMTNSYVYALKKSFLGINLNRISLQDIKNVSYADALEINTTLGDNISLAVQGNKKSLARKAVGRLKSRLA